MTALAELRHHMAHAKEVLVGDAEEFGRPEEMVRAVQAMRAKVASGKAIVSRDRIREALALVNTRGAEQACESHLRYLCWALWEALGQNKALIARNDGAVGQVLDAVARDLGSKTLSLSAWRGLLAAYLDPSDQPQAEPEVSNWLQVRDFLSKTLKTVIDSSRFQPDWLKVLADNAQILTGNPCGVYAAAVSQGDTTAVDALKEYLSISDESWFWKALILSQVRHLCSHGNQAYLDGLDNVLGLLANHPALADDALLALLPRHHNGLAEHAHPGLQDFAVKHWGSPNIFSQAKWSLVDEAVKQMVREWLVKEDLKDFFSLLQADQAADQRRLNFWLEYAKQIDFAHFVLGSWVWDSPRADYVEMKRRKRSRIARLDAPSPTNNAFILKLGDYFFVEFGETGNACYMYRADDLPFDIRRSQHSLYDLKSKRKAIAHPSHSGSWEWKFKQQLERFGIFPDKDRRAGQRPSTPYRPAAPAQPQPTQRTTPVSTTPFASPPQQPRPQPQPTPAQSTQGQEARFRMSELRGLQFPAANRTPELPQARPPSQSSDDWAAQARDIARKYSIELLDQRSKGGCLWLLTKAQRHPAADVLTGLGFKFADGRGYWRKK